MIKNSSQISHGSTKKVGIVLMNLGTPKSPKPEDVGRYLNEFLTDPYVIDIPFLLRQLLVRVLIVPRRKYASSEAYEKVWRPEGSPLAINTKDLAESMQRSLGDKADVKWIMRYGEPSIHSIQDWLLSDHLDRVIFVPLYPQATFSSTVTGVDNVRSFFQQTKHNTSKFEIATSFFDRSYFIRAVAEKVKKVWEKEACEHLLITFHGLPERHIRKTWASADSSLPCLKQTDCCESLNKQNVLCYRAQCFQTARRVALALTLSRHQYTVGFQSRLGRTPWIKPYTDELYSELAKKGIRKLAVVAPSFMADCLETLEEIALRGEETFLEAGGQALHYVPAINDDPQFAKEFGDDLLTNEHLRLDQLLSLNARGLLERLSHSEALSL